MNHYLVAAKIAICLTCFGTVASAQAEPDAGAVTSTDVVPTQAGEITSEGEAISEAADVWKAINSRDYMPAFASVLALVIFGTRRYLFNKVEWFATRIGGTVYAFGVAGGVALFVGIKAGEPLGGSLIVNSLTLAVTAGGVWALRRVPRARE